MILRLESFEYFKMDSTKLASTQSSGSTNVIHSPFAIDIPAFLAAETPWFV